MISVVRTSRFAAIAAAACAVFAASANAAPYSRSWTGASGVNNAWNNTNNWNGTGSILSSDFTAVFDRVPTVQPSVTSTVSSVGGIRMTGADVGNIEISSSSAITLQAEGKLQDNPGVGVLVDNTSTGALTINTTSFKLGVAQSWINNSGNLLTIASPVNFNALALTVSGTGNTLLSGGTTATGGSLTKTGSGTLTISGSSNLQTGTTTVSSGTLLVTGTLSSSTAVLTANGGVVGGTGTIGRPTTINADAILAPGLSSLAAATLTFDRSLSLAGTTRFDILSETSNDLISVNPTGSNSPARPLTFGGTLQVDASGVTFADGQTFDLFNWGNNTTRSGTFSSIVLPTLSGGLSWKMFGDQPFDYTTGQITVVPEPASLGVLGGIAAGLMLSRRQRRRAK